MIFLHLIYCSISNISKNNDFIWKGHHAGFYQFISNMNNLNQ